MWQDHSSVKLFQMPEWSFAALYGERLGDFEADIPYKIRTRLAAALHLDIHGGDAGLTLGMPAARMPRPVQRLDISHIVNRHTPIFPARRQSALAITSELEHQNTRRPIASSDRVGAAEA